MTNAHVPLPEFDLREDTPVSAAFGDVYFSRAGGMAETEHVFLRGNGLPARWAGRSQFTIGELGFGTGLNFLVTWRAFLAQAEPDAHLHYTAIEKFPLTPDMLRTALALQPELRTLADALIDAYPLRLPGLHRLHLPRVSLTLCFGEVSEMLEEWDTPIDAWFLDGFSPAKNPAMWNDAIMAQLARLSAPGASVATFTAAGSVRRGLAAAGFAMRKVVGYGHKRDMLVGILPAPAAPARRAHAATLIVGGGIAGCTLARALAERGVAVTLLEAGAVAGGASGNAAAVLFPQLSKRWGVSAAWYFTAYGFMLRQLRRWRPLDFPQHTIGMLRLPRHAAEEAQLRALHETLGLDSAIVRWVEREEASAWAGVPLATGAAWFAEGTWLAPDALCRALLQHPLITYREQTGVSSLVPDGATWCATTHGGEELYANNVCITAAHDCPKLLPSYNLKLHAVGGQVSDIAAADVAAPLRSILCYTGYVIPCGERYLIGATYNHGDDALSVTAANHARNLQSVEQFLPGWVRGPASGGRTSLRATTPDRLPYVGMLAPGLYVSTGHGSRGMLSAPLAAEMIASDLTGAQVPLTQALRRAVHPLRFRPS